MKKRIAALLLVVFSLAIFAGCSPTTNQYFDEYQKVASWKGTESTVDMDMGFDNLDGQSIQVSMKGYSKAITKDGIPQLAYAKMNLGEIKAAENGAFTLPDLEMYMDMRNANHQEYYVNKGFIKGVVAYMGVAENSKKLIAQLDSLPGEFVKLDLQDQAGVMVNPDFMRNPVGIAKDLLSDLYAGVDMPVDFTKDGNTYSLEMNEDDVVDLVKASVDGYSKNKEKVNADLVKIYGPELTKQIIPELEQGIASLNKEELNQGLNELEGILKGSSVKMKETFGKDVYDSDLALDLKLHMDNQPMSVKIKSVSQAKRNDQLSIELPKNAAQLNFDDFMVGNILVTVDGQPVHFADQQPVIQNDRTLVPYRAIAEATGAKVEWNNDTRTVTVDQNGKKVSLKIDDKTAKVDGKEMALDAPATIINSRTMVPLRFVGESLGYKVEWHGDAQLVTLNKIA